ncbi:MAG: metallophosphatase [Planctomycetaceae bacterium]|nr:MAG: metallophosphatase [Planctomycetaceae bacterium]
MHWPHRIDGPLAIIGDVHGQTDKLQRVLEQLRELPQHEQRWVVFLGDFVDRGPDPRGTIECVLQFMQQHPRVTSVMGNHEFAMGCALGWFPVPDYADWGPRWVEHYDTESTFASYGVPWGDLPALQQAIPPTHQQFLAHLPWIVEHPHYVIVHAGLDPNMPFELQRRILRQRDFTHSRPPWLCARELVESDPPPDCPHVVISGHLCRPKVEIYPRRILVDTTGGRGGVLSCVLLPERRVLTSDPQTKPRMTSRAWWKFWARL